MNLLQSHSGACWISLFILTVCDFQVSNGNAASSVQQPQNDYDFVRAIQLSLQEHELRRSITKRRSKRDVKRVCYGELGCFEDTGPFAYLEMLPTPPEEINTKFFFYSTRNRSDRPLMELPFLNMTAAFAASRQKRLAPDKVNGGAQPSSAHGAADAAASSVKAATATTPTPTPTKRGNYQRRLFTIDDMDGFDELSVRIIVHGFGSACPHVWIYEMKTALMAVEDCIVICVDWENGATFPNYVRAATNTRLVGKQLAMLIDNLREFKGLNLTRTHIIGFSLGAHVSGFAGAALDGLARITGLDPAGPLFESQHPKARLDSSDAEFVDVIHSNGENLILGGLGSWQPMGHVDFYPNGGRVQTGCTNLFVGAVTDFIWSAQTAEEEEGRSLCNHRRAYKFFIDSVAPRCLFPAFTCSSYDDFLKGKCFPCAQDQSASTEAGARCGNMGYYANRSTGRGQLYLVTREEEPFCAHQFQLQIFNSFNELPLRTIGRLEAILEGEGGLNETFQISEKDDFEFFAGNIVSKIIVPHPALGFPTTLSLNYKSYSGWLSKGLPHWDIDKVILTDSFGRSHSQCKPSTKLSSGQPVRLKLHPGDCVLENEEQYGAFTVSPTTKDHVEPSAAYPAERSGPPGGAAVKKLDDILHLQSNERGNDTDSSADVHGNSWQSIIDGNSLDKEVSESSRSLSSIEGEQEIFEPILKDRRLAVDSGRRLAENVGPKEILEPVLRATTPRIQQNRDGLTTMGPSANVPAQAEVFTGRKSDERQPTAIETNTESINVQILPFRLGDLLHRAERYARETLLPLISIQAPKFFGFNVGNDTKPKAVEEYYRRPRYIPRVAEPDSNDATTEQKPKKRDLAAAESKGERNIFQLIHSDDPNETEEGDQQRYYTNVFGGDGRSLRPEGPEYVPIFIDLTTYRPTPTDGHPTERTVHRKGIQMWLKAIINP